MSRVRRWMTRVLALCVGSALGARPVGADCPQEKNEVTVLIAAGVSGTYDQSLADTLADSLGVSLSRLIDGVEFKTESDVVKLALHENDALRMGDDASLGGLESAVGPPFVLSLDFSKSPTLGQKVSGALVSMRTGDVVRRVLRSLPDDQTLQPAQMDAVAASIAPDLRCDLLAVRVRPAVPVILLSLSPAEVNPGEQVHLQVTLRDSSDDQVQPGKFISLEYTSIAGDAPAPGDKPAGRTDALGRWAGDVPAGDEPGDHTLVASFVGADGATTRSAPARYRVRDVGGDVEISSPAASLHFGEGSTVTARVMHDGAPVAGASVAFTTSGGGSVETPAATTGADGYASTQYDAPGDDAVVDVAATTSRTGAPDATADLTFVVDGGVALNVNAPDTVAGATSDVAADLVVGGTPIAGTNVSFTLSGGGSLSAASAPTDDAGRAEVTWTAPAGTSSADITAEAIVDGQPYTQTVTVHASPRESMSVKVVPRMGLYQTLAYCPWVPSDTGLPAVCSAATLSAVYSDCGGSWHDEVDATPADPPVTLRAEVNGCRDELDVTRSDPQTIVVDCSGLGDRYGGFEIYTCLDLTFDEPGVLTVESKPSITNQWESITGKSMTKIMALRSSSGPSIPDGAAYGAGLVNVLGDEGDYRGFTVPPARSGTVDIAQPETLQIVLLLVAYTDTSPISGIDGGTRFTLKFNGR